MILARGERSCNFLLIEQFLSFGLAWDASNGLPKPKKTFVLYLRYALTNPKSETTFANRHGGFEE